MKLIRFFVASVLFCGIASGVAQAAPEAILTGVQGAVQIVQNGKSSAAKNGAPLNAGDSVLVGAGGAATVYYANRPPQSLKANQQIKVAAPGASTRPSVWNNVYKGVAAGFARRGEKVGGTVRADEPPFASKEIVPLSPVDSRVLARPVLWWALRDAPGDFEVTLIADFADSQVLWTGKTKQNFVAIPPQVPLATGMKYRWRVTSRDKEGEEKSSYNAWFEIAPPTEVLAAKQEQDEIANALKTENEGTRRVAQATALAERGFYDEAIALLTNRVLETNLANDNTKGDVKTALAAFDAMLGKMDEAARWQLRKLYADSKQIELGSSIAPDLTAPLSGEQTPAVSEQKTDNRLEKTTDYADPEGAFALRVPAGWTVNRETGEGLWFTQFSSGAAKDGQISVITQPLQTPQNLETFGAKWLQQIVDFLGANGTVKPGEVQKTKFLGRDAMRMAVDSDAPQTGAQRGFLNVIFGEKNALLIGYAAPTEKPLELSRMEAILNSFALESKTPATNAKTAETLGVDLSPLAALPPALRETIAQSEALISIGYEILNPPLMGQDENGKLFSPEAMRAAFDYQTRQVKAAPLASLSRWRSARDSAALAMQLSWMAGESKKKTNPPRGLL